MTKKKKVEAESTESEVTQDEAVEVEETAEEVVETESEKETEETAEAEVEAEVEAESEEVAEAEAKVEEDVEETAEEVVETESEKETEETAEAEVETEVEAESEEVVEADAKGEEEAEEKVEEAAESVPYISPDEPVAAEVPAAKESAEEAAEDEEDEEDKIDVDKALWYTIRTFSGQERKIMESLLATIDREGMEDKIFQVLVPTENVIEMRDGKKRHRVKVNFPGYVLIQMDLDKETQFLIEDAYGVLNFIGPGNKPQALGRGEVQRILGDAKEKAKGAGIAAPYVVGDSIKVVDGPFNDFAGYVQEINQEKQKVKVMVSIFGRATPVELDFLQVQIEK